MRVDENLLCPEKASFKDQMTETERYIYENLPDFTPHKEWKAEYKLIVPPEIGDDVFFDSHFECGNLRKAVKLSEFEYNLVMENDVNTHGHSHWFYFKIVTKFSKGDKLKLNFINFLKPQSLYLQGMRPVIRTPNSEF